MPFGMRETQAYDNHMGGTAREKKRENGVIIQHASQQYIVGQTLQEKVCDAKKSSTKPSPKTKYSNPYPLRKIPSDFSPYWSAVPAWSMQSCRR